MKTNKEKVYDTVQKKILSGKYSDGITTSQVADITHIHRSNVSKLLNELVREKRLNKTNGRPVKFQLPTDYQSNVPSSVFTTLIGHEGSLRKQIQLAQAAVLYPKESLNMVIISNPGTGRSLFVNKIYDFAKQTGVLETANQLIKINCKNYSHDYETLNETLVGDKDKRSVNALEKVQGGILFIDNAELLNSKDIERLIDSVNQRKKQSNTLLIIGTNEDNKDLFSTKIPISIELPDYHERPISERFELVNQFFHIEAINSNRIIKVDSDVVKALIVNTYENNIDHLEIEIKNISAKAYLRVINDSKQHILVNNNDLNPQTRKGLINIKFYQEELYHLFGKRETLYYGPEDGYISIDNLRGRTENLELYDSMNQQYEELTLRGFDTQSIATVLNSHINNLFDQFNYKEDRKSTYNLSSLSTIVDQKIIDLVQEFMEQCTDTLRHQYSSSVFFGLCLHIHSLIQLKLIKKRVNNEQIVQIIQDYPTEYALSAQFTEKLQNKFGIEIPIDEIVIITMFIIETDESETQTQTVLLYILHGDNVATSLMKVTNQLTQLKNSYAYDLALNKAPKEAMKEIEQLMHQIDEGKGIIVIYDMGSIKPIVESIAEKTSLKIRLIQVPISLIGLEIARQSSSSNDIDYIYHHALNNINKLLGVDKDEEKLNLIITLCHTSEGGAIQMKQYIEEHSKLNDRVVAMSVTDKENLTSQVMELRRNYNIRAFVGTFDPYLLGIPFISFGKVFEHDPENLDKVLTFSPIIESHSLYEGIYKNFEENFNYTPINQLKEVLPDVAENFYERYELNKDESIGLFMHFGAMIERMLSGEDLIYQPDMEKITNLYNQDYTFISQQMKVLEKAFDIIITDHEIAILITIVNKL